MGEILLEINNMNKNFGSTIALKNVSLSVRRGEIRGLIGENGSGKSTITSIVAGMQKATSGEMLYKNDKWNPASMVEAQKKGISMILQEANTISNCTVAENLFAGQEDRFTRFGVFNRRSMNRAAEEMLKKFGIQHMRGEDNINQYSFEDRKLIEIIRAVNDDTEILVVDETTTALSFEGRNILYDIMQNMMKKDKAVIFISHDLEEILGKCTVLTILRDGNIVSEIQKEEMDRLNIGKDVRRMMVGREIGDAYYRDDFDSSCQEETVLEFKQVCFEQLENFTLQLHKGEIVGLGGLSGCGMHEVGRIGFGIEKLKSGEVSCNNKRIMNEADAVSKGIGYISKNRDVEALIMDCEIQTNIVLPMLPKVVKATYVNPGNLHKIANEQIKALSIKCQNGKQWVSTLSGGNKQKVSFAKWLANDSQVIIMDCPTRGVDIGVKQAMYALINEMKKEGRAILMISEELPELIGMVDRLIIMKDFKISHEFKRSPDLKETDIIEYMI